MTVSTDPGSSTQGHGGNPGAWGQVTIFCSSWLPDKNLYSKVYSQGRRSSCPAPICPRPQRMSRAKQLGLCWAGNTRRAAKLEWLGFLTSSLVSAHFLKLLLHFRKGQPANFKISKCPKTLTQVMCLKDPGRALWPQDENGARGEGGCGSNDH